MKRFSQIVIAILLCATIGCSSISGLSGGTAGPAKPANAVEIHIIYAPEEEPYTKEAMDAFNASYSKGINPVTSHPLGKDEKPLWVTG